MGEVWCGKLVKVCMSENTNLVLGLTLELYLGINTPAN